MKEYSIWLKSGACIEGEIDEETANIIMASYSFNPNSGDIKRYRDSNGFLLISFKLIEAIAFNDTEPDKSVGFTNAN